MAIFHRSCRKQRGSSQTRARRSSFGQAPLTMPVSSHRTIRVLHEFGATAILVALGFAAFRTFAFFLAGGGL
jgi:hypothetical protein